MTESRMPILRKVPLFANLDERVLKDIAAHIRRRRFAPEEALFREGEPGQVLYIVVSGSVRIQKTSPSGDTLFIAQCGPGEQFGELALIDGAPRMADVITAEPTELLMLDREDFLHCLATQFSACITIMSSLAERLRRSADRLESYQRLSVTSRVAQTLLELSEHYAPQTGEGTTAIEFKISQQQLGVQVGATRETVNRSVSLLKSAQAIRMNGREIIVLDKDILTRFARGDSQA